MILKVTETQAWSISNALRIAADQYEKDAAAMEDAKIPSLAIRFKEQYREAHDLMLAIDNGELS